MARDFQITLQHRCGSGLQNLLNLRDLRIIVTRHFVLGNTGSLITRDCCRHHSEDFGKLKSI